MCCAQGRFSLKFAPPPRAFNLSGRPRLLRRRSSIALPGVRGLARRAARGAPRVSAVALSALSGFLLCMFTPQAQATSVEGFTFTNSLIEPDCSPPPATSEFLTADPRVTLWVRLHDVRVGDAYVYTWYDPSGRLFHRHALTRDDELADTCSWSSLTLQGGLAASRPGRWRVQLTYNGAVQIDQTFLLSDSGRVEESTLTTAQPDPSGQAAPAPTPIVRASDAQLSLAVHLEALHAGDSYAVNWVDPTGASALTQTIPVDTEMKKLTTWSTLPLKDGLEKPPVPGRWRAEISINGQTRKVVPFVLRPERPLEVRADLKALYGDGAAVGCSKKANPIELRLLAHGGRAYRDPTSDEAMRMEAILNAMVAGQFELAESLAQALQLSVNRYLDSRTRRPVWVLEPALMGSGPGYSVLLFYRPDGDPGLIAEIPHPGRDDRTMDYGLELLRRGASMLLVAGADAATNYRPVDRLEAPLCALQLRQAELVPGLDDSDVVKNEESMFHRVHTWAVERAAKLETPPMVVQFRGFDDDIREGRTTATRGCDHNIILANGMSDQTAESPLLVELGSQLGRYSLKGRNKNSRYDYNIFVHPGQDCSALSATGDVNSQARQTRQAGGTFVSVALDEEMRGVSSDVDAAQVGAAVWDTFLSSWHESDETASRHYPATASTNFR